MSELLEDDAMARWVAWKRAADAVWAEVVRQITAATGLSAADFSVLTRVVESPDGALRQQELADALGWQRSRLSRQLSRMTERGLVERAVEPGVRTIHPTPTGRSVARRARTVHARAVRAALLDRTPASVDDPFWTTVRTLAEHG